MSELACQDWFQAPATQKVMNALLSEGKDARFIGGCVRDALLNKTVNDIDIATQEKPVRVMALLEQHGIKAIATGLAHGTVTAICDSQKFEITTLRKDVETDGRRAVVAFSEDWLEDANRRDFTFNAMSLDANGVLYDPFDGLSDLKAGKVRFIGCPHQRIREDYLRILRFFRFNAFYGKAVMDGEGLKACQELAAGMDELSGERITQEFLRLLEAPRPAKWVSSMKKAGILTYILPRNEDPMNLEMLCAFEERADRIRRLSILVPPVKTDVLALCKRLRLSNAQKTRLLKARCNAVELIPSQSQEKVRAFLYRYGSECARDHVFLYWAEKGFTGIGPKEQALMDLIDHWDKSPVTFPLSGKDVMAMGVKAGPFIGQVLQKVEDWWTEAGCFATKEECLSYLAEQIKKIPT